MNDKKTLASLADSRSASDPKKKRSFGPLLLLLVFIAGAGLVFYLVFGNRLQPRVPVTVTSALLLESDQVQTHARPAEQGALLAQASGWIEPDPFPVYVPVLVDGFVEDVFVYSGDRVKEGQLLTTLDPADFQLAHDHAAAALAEAEAQLRVQQNRRAEAEADLAAAQAELESIQASNTDARDQLERFQQLEAGDVPERAIFSAEQTAATAEAASNRARAAVQQAEATLASRAADVDRQQAAIEQSRSNLRQAELNLERTQIVSPMDGRVLKRYALPGGKRRAAMDDPESAAVVSLYDPDRLQVRVDVALADAGSLHTGMPARVATAALPGQSFTGTVTRITGQADITRNTLQVKVGLKTPHPAMRPEMLCRVEFYADPKGRGNTTVRSRQVWLSEDAVEDRAPGETSVWVVDPVTETVVRRTIQIGSARKNGWTHIPEGLRPGEKVVVDAPARLRAGSRIAIESQKETP